MAIEAISPEWPSLGNVENPIGNEQIAAARDNLYRVLACDNFVLLSHRSSNYMTGEGLIDVYCQTMIAGDGYFSRDERLEQFSVTRRSFNTIRKYLESLDELSGTPTLSSLARIPSVLRASNRLQHLLPNEEAKFAYGKGRSLVWTENDALGLVPSQTQYEDVLFIPEGGRMPLVIRPRPDNRFTFIGAAYVHGMMYGEAFTRKVVSDLTKITLI